MSQCDVDSIENDTPHVCCARNDESLIIQSSQTAVALAPNQQQQQQQPLSSALFGKMTMGDSDESIEENALLPNRSECGREHVENRIYSGQVSKKNNAEKLNVNLE
jgi:hypothetical protein